MNPRMMMHPPPLAPQPAPPPPMPSAASMDLVLKGSCEGCGSTTDLYGSNCKHMTLCLSCGKAMAAARSKCYACGSVISRLIREYNVRASSSADKMYSIGRFATGLPSFSKKKHAENKWSLHKEGLQGRQLTDSLREKLRNKPWILEDETGQHQYQGQVEGAHSTAYYLLMMHGHGKEFVAVPAGSWYNFNKIAQYKQLTLEEAEDKMKNRKRTADGYERWMMKAAANGAAAFGAVEKEIVKSEVSDGNRRKKGKGDSGEDAAEKAEEDEGEEEMKKNKPSLNKKSVDDDENPAEDFDLDDDDVEKGDDWEHEETFTDDDEAVGNDPLERLDLEREPTPPRIKDDEEDEEHEEEGGAKLTAAGKELKKLLGRANGLNESDAEEEEEEEDVEDDAGNSPVLAPKQKDAPKEEPSDNSPSKAAPGGSSRGTPSTSKSGKSKRKHGSDDAKSGNGGSVKKAKTDNDSKSSSVKDEPVSSARNSASSNGPTQSSSKTGSTSTVGPDIEEEIRTVLLQMAPVTTQDLVARFRSRLRTKEDKAAFTEILRKMSRIQKIDGASYVVLREK
ncbi:Transcription initiation factor IIF subunit alpha [Acorus calamus]|uniref:Transcription initiation factor IIF subunit alpha n=1 Tax=Acorus calamus TaxID=4465 RepID=A0AAV9EPR6_ACOCL|nr:Transcription initiation factor IIF subunit alpha [Acorus calamus]